MNVKICNACLYKMHGATHIRNTSVIAGKQPAYVETHPLRSSYLPSSFKLTVAEVGGAGDTPILSSNGLQ